MFKFDYFLFFKTWLFLNQQFPNNIMKAGRHLQNINCGKNRVIWILVFVRVFHGKQVCFRKMRLSCQWIMRLRFFKNNMAFTYMLKHLNITLYFFSLFLICKSFYFIPAFRLTMHNSNCFAFSRFRHTLFTDFMKDVSSITARIDS